MREARLFLVAIAALVLGALGCGLVNAGAPADARGPATAALAPRLTESPTARPTVVLAAAPRPTRTPVPLPPLESPPDIAEEHEFLYRTDTLEVYADPRIDPDLRRWLLAQPQHFDRMVRRVEQRLAARLRERVVLLVQPPEAGEGIRANCPARGAATLTDEGHLLIYLFADAQTEQTQKDAVVAHEIAHQVIRAKLGRGGDMILNEGLANWAIPRYWRPWQQSPSFDSFVLDSLLLGDYVPLAESVERNLAEPAPGEDCFETRDQIYNQWASFSDFLIRRYGWNAIGRFWRQDAEDWHDFDYRTGFGRSLEALEQEWLRELWQRGV